MIAVASILVIVANVHCNCFTETQDELCNVTHTKSIMCLQKSTSLLLTVTAFGASAATAVCGASTCKENNWSSI